MLRFIQGWAEGRTAAIFNFGGGGGGGSLRRILIYMHGVPTLLSFLPSQLLSLPSPRKISKKQEDDKNILQQKIYFFSHIFKLSRNLFFLFRVDLLFVFRLSLFLFLSRSFCTFSGGRSFSFLSNVLKVLRGVFLRPLPSRNK